MKRIVQIVLIFGLLFSLSQNTKSQQKNRAAKNAQSKSLTAEQIAKKFIPSMVLIVCDDGKGAYSQGSGFFIGSGVFVKSSVILTNFHVIRGMVRGKVKIVGGDNKANEWWVDRIIATDSNNDLALLSINEVDKRKTPPLVLSSSGTPAIGEKIYVLSNPKGLSGTLSQGIISSEVRQIEGTDLLQIDAPISPGSSGGAVLNVRGDVVGIATASLASGQNLNFAVPSRTIGRFTLAELYLSDERSEGFVSSNIENGWSTRRPDSNGTSTSKADNDKKVSSSQDIAKPKASDDLGKLSYGEITALLKSSLQNYSVSDGEYRAKITSIGFSDCTMDFSLSVTLKDTSGVDAFTTSYVADLGYLRMVAGLAGSSKDATMDRVLLMFNRKLAEVELNDDGSQKATLTDSIFVPVPAELKKFTTLFNGLNEACSEGKYSSKSIKRSFAETASWLTDKIEGTEDHSGATTWKTERLRFSGCNMTKIEIGRSSGYGLGYTYKPNLADLKSVEVGKNQAGKWGVWLKFGKGYVVEAENAFGQKENSKREDLVLILGDYENSKRVAAAFARLLELCGEQTKEPF